MKEAEGKYCRKFCTCLLQDTQRKTIHTRGGRKNGKYHTGNLYSAD